MIDLLFTLVHFCASCAPAANSLSTSGGLLGGAAGAAGGVGGAGGLAGGDGSGAGAGAGAGGEGSGAGAGGGGAGAGAGGGGEGGGGNGAQGDKPWYSGQAPAVSGPGGLQPGDYGYADPADPLTDPNDLPLQDDPWGNAIPGMVLGPLGGLADSVPAELTGLEALGKAWAGELEGIRDDLFTGEVKDTAQHYGQMLEAPIPEDPGTFHMGQTLTNPDGSTTNPDGTPGLPPNQTPAYNPDGTRALTDPSNPPDGS